MAEFDSHKGYLNFRKKVMNEQRYFRDDEIEHFLETVVATSQSRVEILSQGTIVYRAQRGHDYFPARDGELDEDRQMCGFDSTRMTPFRWQASEGRANPKGLPVLYVATENDTAMAEVRPSMGEFVSCAQFRLKRELRVVRCSPPEGQKRKLSIYSDNFEPEPKVRERTVWNDIDRAFSRPVTLSDMIADYVPTQVLAELFKKHGFDGVAYESSLGEGHNIAIFDIDAAKLINCSVYSLEKVEYSFSEFANRYFVRENADSETPLS